MQLAGSDREVPVTSLCPVAPVPVSTEWSHTILVVEDEAFVRDVACKILSSAGYCVLPARSATDAVLTFRSHPRKVQLLLTDVVLPDRNGCDLALELAAASPDVKVILVSGYPENAVTLKGLPHPGWLYLPKPFSAASLLQKIKSALHGV